MNIRSFQHAFEIIAHGAKNGFARSYARAGIMMNEADQKTQALYVLSNMQGERDEKVKAARSWLKINTGSN